MGRRWSPPRTVSILLSVFVTLYYQPDMPGRPFCVFVTSLGMIPAELVWRRQNEKKCLTTLTRKGNERVYVNIGKNVYRQYLRGVLVRGSTCFCIGWTPGPKEVFGSCAWQLVATCHTTEQSDHSSVLVRVLIMAWVFLPKQQVHLLGFCRSSSSTAVPRSYAGAVRVVSPSTHRRAPPNVRLSHRSPRRHERAFSSSSKPPPEEDEETYIDDFPVKRDQRPTFSRQPDEQFFAQPPRKKRTQNIPGVEARRAVASPPSSKTSGKDPFTETAARPHLSAADDIFGGGVQPSVFDFVEAENPNLKPEKDWYERFKGIPSNLSVSTRERERLMKEVHAELVREEEEARRMELEGVVDDDVEEAGGEFAADVGGKEFLPECNSEAEDSFLEEEGSSEKFSAGAGAAMNQLMRTTGTTTTTLPWEESSQWNEHMLVTHPTPEGASAGSAGHRLPPGDGSGQPDKPFYPREDFQFGHYPHWFPGHMSRARVQIKNHFDKGVDVVLEVRDARAPFSTCQYEVMNELNFRVEFFFLHLLPPDGGRGGCRFFLHLLPPTSSTHPPRWRTRRTTAPTRPGRSRRTGANG